MGEPCTQEVNIAVITQRLKSGDGILEKLSTQMESLVLNMSKVLNHIEGDEGILAKQKEHGDVVGKITNLEIIDKVNRHDRWYIVGAFLIGFLGLTSVSSIIALLFIVVRLYNTLHP